MRRLVVCLFVLALAAPAWAQRPQGRGFGGGGSGLGLLSQQSVKDELKLSDDQAKQVEELSAKQREAFSGLRDLSREERREKFAEFTKEAQTRLNSILNADQLKRLRQITLQQRGGDALADPEVAESLGLSDEQKGRIRELAESARDEMRNLFAGGAADGDRAEIRKKLEAARAALNEKFQGVLNAEQQAKWKELLGEPFKGELRRGFGGPGGGEGGPRRRNRDNDQTNRAIQPAEFLAALFTSTGPLASLAFLAAEEDQKADAKDGDDQDRRKADARKSKSRARQPAARGEARARRRPPGPPNFARRGENPRDRAWSHVARAMGEHRGPGGFGSPWDGFRGRRVSWTFTRRPEPHRHHGRMVAHRGFPRHFAHWAHARGGHPHWGHRPHPAHFGPAMAFHRWHHGPHGPRMGHHRWHRGPHAPPIVHHGHHPPRHAPPAHLAGHRGPRGGAMHMAGFRYQRPHGHHAGKHGDHRRDDDRKSRDDRRKDKDRNDD